MNKTTLLLKSKLTGVKNRIGIGTARRPWKLSYKKIIVSVSALAFLAVLYFMFYRVLMYLLGVPLLGPILIFKLISMVFLTFWLMLVYSNIITAFTTFYFSSDLPFLLSSPFSFKDVFTVKYLETTLYSSWTIMAVFIPFFLAFARVYSINFTSFLLGSFAMIPFFFTASGIGVIAALLLMSVFPTKRTRDFSLVIGVILGGSVYLLFRFLQPEKLLNPEDLGTVMNYLHAMKTPSMPYLPSNWVTETMVSVANGAFLEYTRYLLYLVSFSAMLAAVNLLAARKLYYTSWALSCENSTRKKQGKWGRWSLTGSRIQRAMQEKDIRMFIRDTSQWSQLFLLAALMIVYIFNIYKLPPDAYKVSSITSFFNIGMVGFVLSALSLRFVYPSVSIEGKAYWVVMSSPMSPGRFLAMKYRMMVLPILIIGLMLVYFSNYLLKVDPFIMYISITTIFFMSFGLTGINVGLGAVYPKFHVENITQVESSSGGFMCMVISMVYIGVNIMLIAFPIRTFIMNKFGFISTFYMPAFIIPLVLFIVVNIAAVLIPLGMGKRNLAKLSF